MSSQPILCALGCRVGQLSYAMKTCITHCQFGSHLTTVRKYVNCGGTVVRSGNGDNDASAVTMILSESRPWLEKWDMKSDAFSDSVAFNFFPSLPFNEFHLKLHPLPSNRLQRGENSEILMQHRWKRYFWTRLGFSSIHPSFSLLLTFLNYTAALMILTAPHLIIFGCTAICCMCFRFSFIFCRSQVGNKCNAAPQSSNPVLKSLLSLAQVSVSRSVV